ncbi:MAG: hypothetical protein AUJ98_08300 [Bacteroidetes bacterium CG2_30_33_31]|nr:MAG: hypothetical protein AUJ98_08300 [Bacteroidetes bacterium CG2_30_33_31]
MNLEEEQILKIENLSLGYKSNIIAEKINLTLKKGIMVAIMGANGSGKSTFIKTLAGIIPKISGEIFLHNKNIDAYDRIDFAHKISFVLTDPIFTHDLTVFDLVSFGRYPHTSWLGQLSKKDIEIVNATIEMVAMKGFEGRNIASLSDGELQRVMIAKGLAQECPLMVLDEPTSHLDLKNRLDIINLLRKLVVEQGISILFSTHELNLVKSSADELWLFDNNKKVVSGTPSQLIDNNKLREVFGDAID